MRRAFGQGASARRDPRDDVVDIHLHPERLVVRRDAQLVVMYADVEVRKTMVGQAKAPTHTPSVPPTESGACNANATIER